MKHIIRKILLETNLTDLYDLYEFIPDLTTFIKYKDMWELYDWKYLYENEYDDDLKIEGEDYSSDMGFQKWLYENEYPIRHERAIGFLPDVGQDIYRKINLESLDGIRKNEMGIFWSTEEHCSEAHWAGDGDEYTLVAKLEEGMTDWKQTMLLKVFYDNGNDECEVRLKEGVPITVYELYKGEEQIEIPSDWINLKA